MTSPNTPTPSPTHRILEERARTLARAPEQAEDEADVLELAAFHLAGESYGVPSALVYEIQPLRAHKWSPVPCTPDFILGVVNLRGHLYSIMDLARMLGLPARPLSNHAHLLLVRGGRLPDGSEMELALLADDLPQVLKVSIRELNPPPQNLSSQAQEIVQGMTEEMLAVLDLARLLSDPHIIVYQEI
jgi:purine-binding chemotaxis protein CheW